MSALVLAQKVLEKVTTYHHLNTMKATAAVEISNIIKATYEELCKEIEDSSSESIKSEEVKEHPSPSE